MKKTKENRLVVGSKAWADVIPEWLLEEIQFERITLGLLNLIKPDSQKVGDAEVIAYLMTASLNAPLPFELTEIYTYLAAKIMKRKKKKIDKFMQDKLERGLSEYERTELERLRNTIYKQRGGDISHPLLDVLREM